MISVSTCLSDVKDHPFLRVEEFRREESDAETSYDVITPDGGSFITVDPLLETMNHFQLNQTKQVKRKAVGKVRSRRTWYNTIR